MVVPFYNNKDGLQPVKWAMGAGLESIFHSISRAFSNRYGLDLWCQCLANRCIIFQTDNMSIVNIINSQTSKDVLIMYLVRRLAITTMLYNIMFRAVHIPGYDNCIADCLSRFQVQRAMKLNPNLSITFTLLPTQLLPGTIPIPKSSRQHCH